MAIERRWRLPPGQELDSAEGDLGESHAAIPGAVLGRTKSTAAIFLAEIGMLLATIPLLGSSVPSVATLDQVDANKTF